MSKIKRQKKKKTVPGSKMRENHMRDEHIEPLIVRTTKNVKTDDE